MKCCVECGTKLEMKFLKNEGLIPYCPNCQAYRFPIFSAAVSMIILNQDDTKALLVKQYGKDRNILVAGYINKGESAEEAVKREMQEEIGVSPLDLHFTISHYWEKSNTLLFNYLVHLEKMELKTNEEIDSYDWYDVNIVDDIIPNNSLVKYFWNYYLENIKKM